MLVKINTQDEQFIEDIEWVKNQCNINTYSKSAVHAVSKFRVYANKIELQNKKIKELELQNQKLKQKFKDIKSAIKLLNNL